MKYVYVFVSLFVAIRTISYAIWCKKDKNLLGFTGVFILVLMLIYQVTQIY